MFCKLAHDNHLSAIVLSMASCSLMLGCSESMPSTAKFSTDKNRHTRQENPPTQFTEDHTADIVFAGDIFELSDSRGDSAFSSQTYILKGESEENWSKRISLDRYSAGTSPIQKARESERRLGRTSEYAEAEMSEGTDGKSAKVFYLLWPDRETAILGIRTYRTDARNGNLITEAVSVRIRTDQSKIEEVRATLDKLRDATEGENFPETPAIRERNTPHVGRMPIYVTPYYDSNGPKVAVGQFDHEIASATKDSITQVASKVEAEWPTLRIETMFVLAIRNHDLDQKDDAAFWYYSALMRAQMFESAVVSDSKQKRELSRAFLAFGQLIGSYLHGRPLDRTEQFRKNVERALAKSHELPDLLLMYPQFTFKEATSWSDDVVRIRDQFEKLLRTPTKNDDRG
ncbi:MAG: hypothetical protein ACYTGL_10130 [Planctomycetota bacterium]|jgi:hypothetical protein